MEINKNLLKYSPSELYGLRCAAKSICDDYAEMSSTYNLVHGGSSYDELPPETKALINERQRFFGYVQQINQVLELKLKEVFNEN